VFLFLLMQWLKWVWLILNAIHVANIHTVSTIIDNDWVKLTLQHRSISAVLNGEYALHVDGFEE
jgi:hypothetical protein